MKIIFLIALLIFSFVFLISLTPKPSPAEIAALSQMIRGPL